MKVRVGTTTFGSRRVFGRFMKRLLLYPLLLIFLLFVAPLLVHIAIWAAQDRPRSWSSADWGPSGVLPPPRAGDSAAVYVMSARTGGLKGAVAVHSWIVTKKRGAVRYDRYDVVGWGSPVRVNSYPADGRWYSNDPVIHHSLLGEQAERAIPRVEAAVREYRWRNRGDYSIWPGPNSNSFVAHVAREAGLGTALPATALGRDYPADGRWFAWPENGHGLRLTLGGYLGLTIGGLEGIEANFLGAVFGFDPATWTLKLPGFGGVRLLGSA